MAVEQTWNLSQTPYMTDPDPDSALWLGIWLATIALLGIPLNLFVIIGTLTSKLVQKNSTDFFLANLACADTVCLLSGALHLYYVLFHDESVCQISGFSLYVSAVTSIMLPVFIAISRCVYIADERSRLISALRPLFCKTGIAMMNVFIWLSQMSYAIPLLIFDKFGFDPIGTCGVSKMPPIFGLFYFFIVPLSLATLWYFYRKLEFIVKQISLELSLVAIYMQDRMRETNNLLKMLKWIAILPVVLSLPATIVQIGLQWEEQFVSIRTGRLVSAIFPLSHLINPFLTVRFSRAFRQLLQRVIVRTQTADRLFSWLFNMKKGGRRRSEEFRQTRTYKRGRQRASLQETASLRSEKFADQEQEIVD